MKEIDYKKIINNARQRIRTLVTDLGHQNLTTYLLLQSDCERKAQNKY